MLLLVMLRVVLSVVGHICCHRCLFLEILAGVSRGHGRCCFYCVCVVELQTWPSLGEQPVVPQSWLLHYDRV
jgi:hypothetical protein